MNGAKQMRFRHNDKVDGSNGIGCFLTVSGLTDLIDGSVISTCVFISSTLVCPSCAMHSFW